MIKFTEHAGTRLTERNITKEQVIKSIESPEFILPARANRKIAVRRFGENFLKVVFAKDENDIIVITNHWISKFKPKR